MSPPSASSRRRSAAGAVLNTAGFTVDAEEDREARSQVRADVADGTASAFAMLARFGVQALSTDGAQGPGDAGPSTGGGGVLAGNTDSPGVSTAKARWMRTTSKVEVNTAARRMREIARLKALQRTPYPMVLARLKLLLERRDMLLEAEEAANNPSPSPGRSLQSSKNTTRVNRTASPFYDTQPDPTSFPTRTGASRQTSVGSTSRRMRASPTRTLRHGVSQVSRASPEPLDNLPNTGGGAGAGELPPLEKVREELAVTFSYVSDFLRKVPEETRNASIDYARMESYKKDQHVYRIGEEPCKFYIILTGSVEVWSHPSHDPKKRTVLAHLKRGQSFGDKDILNGDLRTECITPTSNCTFLIVEAEPFKRIFSDYFEELMDKAQNFFSHSVTMFSKVPEAEGHAVVRHMLHSVYPAGHEWEPHAEAQIYFIKTGTATLESHDRRGNAIVITRAMLNINDAGDGLEAPAVSDSGVLANVVLKDGRAVGTLGHEEEIRRLRRELVPKKVLAYLGPGSHFGGGPPALGQGDLQASLRVLATSDVEAYHCHIEVFLKHASPALRSALRDDAAFKLTYFYGRQDMLGPEPAIGHPSSLLVTCLNNSTNSKSRESSTAVPSTSSTQQGKGGEAPGQQQQPARATAKRKKQVKHSHEPGVYNQEVEGALAYIRSLQAHSHMIQAGAMDSMARAKLVGTAAAEGVLPVPGYMEYLVNTGSTPAERFWSVPALNSSSHRTTALAPLLKQVYPEGLAPLVDKLDQLVARTTHAATHAGVQLTNKPFTQQQQQPRISGERGGSPRRALRARDAHRPATAPSTGALLSAGLVWEREHETARAPALRQILTFEEIARLKAEFHKHNWG